MPTLSRTLVHNWGVTDDATFRTWGRAISDALVAVGLTRSNPVDWTTVIRPAASLGAGVSETFTFGGPLQATYPMSLVLGYTWGSTPGGGVLTARLMLGTAGVPSTSTSSYVTSSNSAYTQTSKDGTTYIASDGESWLACAFGTELLASGNGVLAVERYRNATGAYDAEGAYAVVGTGTSAGVASAGSAGGALALSSGMPVAFPVLNTTSSSLKRGEVALYPHTVLHAGQPPQVIYSGLAGDYATQERVTLPDGRAYLALPAASANHYYQASASAAVGRLLIRSDGATV